MFDYLEEKIAILLIERLYAELNPGGILLIGNFKDQPIRSLIEGAMEWYLIYRTEEELLRLGKKATPKARHYVMSEPEGINLILVISKPLK